MFHGRFAALAESGTGAPPSAIPPFPVVSDRSILSSGVGDDAGPRSTACNSRIRTARGKTRSGYAPA